MSVFRSLFPKTPLFRLLAPVWALPKLKSGETNPDFVREIGETVLEGYFTEVELKSYNERGYGIYHFPNYPSIYPPEGESRFLAGKHIDCLRFVFCDFDLKDQAYPSKEAFLEEVAKLPAKPSLVVDSGRGIHCYWRVKDLDNVGYMYLQFALIRRFKTDISIWTVLQLMRWPWSLHTKDPNNAITVRVLEEHCNPAAVYKMTELSRELPEPTEEEIRKLTRHQAILDGTYVPDMDLNCEITEELPIKFQELMETRPDVYTLFYEPLEAYNGDRSGADAKLCNLLFSLNFPKEQALRVIYNTQKARSYPGDRMQYAANTVDKFYKDRPTMIAESVEEFEERAVEDDESRFVNGPYFMDTQVLGSKWRKTQVLGLIAAPGAGKTAYTLSMFRDFIENNPGNTDIFMMFSLEMPTKEITDRWRKLTNGNPEHVKRLFVVSNEDKDGNIRHLNLQDIYQYARDTKLVTGKNLCALAIDHIGLIRKAIDLRREPNFGIVGEFSYRSGNGHKYDRPIDIETLCSKMKELAKMLDCFLIVQSQTTKARASAGDIPIGKEGAFGTSSFEWYVDYIVTLWQPLLRVYGETDLRVTAWQYVKIRHKTELDSVAEYTPYMLKFDRATGIYQNLVGVEYEQVCELIHKANTLRVVEDKKQSLNYHNSPVRRLRAVLHERSK